MRLAYITNIKIPANDAQSVQVAAMSRAFAKILNDDFKLFSVKSRLNKKILSDYNWMRISAGSFLPRCLRYCLFIFFSIFSAFKFKPDLVYSRDIGVVFVYRLLGFKVVYEMHKPFVNSGVGEFLFTCLCKKIKTVAISQALKDFIQKKYSVEDKNIFVAHDGVWLEQYINLDKKVCRQVLLKELNLSNDSFVVLYSSNLYAGKGLELIIQAAESLPNIIFVIMGRKDLNLDLPSNLHYLGRKLPEEVPTYVLSADLLILPFTKKLQTWKYHSALKMFEYMASNVPILTSNIGSINEILNSDNAFMFSPDQPDQLAENILKIKSNYDLAKEKAVLAKEQVKKYDWFERARNILSFLTY